jgi:hypothetical protein
VLLIFVHGWSVTDTDTYGGLPEALAQAGAAAGLDLEVRHLYLGRYVSFHDEVTIDDVGRAFDNALRQQVPNNANARRKFSCITHSTGGPVVRNWVERFYGAGGLDRLPLQHLVMLAPANFGSALAQLGKSRLSRIANFFQGVEPGQRILDWLELASPEQSDLNVAWMSYRSPENGFYPFVLSGQAIDAKLYDHLNSYTGETGSDGTVRLAAANMNYRRVELVQTDEVLRQRPPTLRMVAKTNVRSPRVPLGIVPDAAHSGKKIGIMRSVTPANAADKPVVDWILRCLKVDGEAAYAALGDELAELSQGVQAREGVPRCAMVVFHIHDDQGRPVTDYDLLLLAGRNYSPDVLPKGFFVDRQRNRRAGNCLTYYLDHDRMSTIPGGALGFRLTARPERGFSHLVAGEFRSEDIPLDRILVANETCLVDMELRRVVDEGVFRLSPATEPRRSFKKDKPSGTGVP